MKDNFGLRIRSDHSAIGVILIAVLFSAVEMVVQVLTVQSECGL
jgi:hypothetical protein